MLPRRVQGQAQVVPRSAYRGNVGSHPGVHENKPKDSLLPLPRPRYPITACRLAPTVAANDPVQTKPKPWSEDLLRKEFCCDCINHIFQGYSGIQHERLAWFLQRLELTVQQLRFHEMPSAHRHPRPDQLITSFEVKDGHPISPFQELGTIPLFESGTGQHGMTTRFQYR